VAALRRAAARQHGPQPERSVGCRLLCGEQLLKEATSLGRASLGEAKLSYVAKHSKRL